jgi:serine/threonine protein kinase
LFEELEKRLDKEGLVYKYRDITRKHKLKLGEGAYSKVTQGWLNGRLVAVKKLKVHRGSTVKSFIREVNALRECADNPHVIRFLGATTKAPKLCIITPYLKGGSLHDMIYKKRVRFSPEQAFRIAQEVAEGMRMVHAVGIIHRDLTPNNILLHPDENGKSFIADFGIAVREQSVTQKGSSSAIAISPKGHPRYKCPEVVVSSSAASSGQQQQRPPITRKVDVYMFGTILYTLYHNKRPYEKLEDKEVVERMCRGEVR